MVSHRRRRSGFFWIACAIVVGTASAAGADEIWVAPTNQQDVGGLGIGSNGIWPATAVGVVRHAWAVPNNLQALEQAKIVLIPHSPGGAATLNVFVCTAQDATNVLAGCAGPFGQPFTGVANELTEVNVSGILAPRIGVPGASYVAVVAYTTPTTGTDHIVGLRFAYTPVAPAGFVTLGENVFSGPQTAPAFVGRSRRFHRELDVVSHAEALRYRIAPAKEASGR